VWHIIDPLEDLGLFQEESACYFIKLSQTIANLEDFVT